MIEIKTNIPETFFIFPDAKILDSLYQKIDKLSKIYTNKKIFIPFGKNEAYAEFGRCFYLGQWNVNCPIDYFPKQKNDLYYIEKVLPKKPKINEIWVFTTSLLENLTEKNLSKLKKSKGLHILLDKENKKWKITRVS